MITFSPFDPYSPYRLPVEQLLLSAFPPGERRPLEQWYQLLRELPHFHVTIATKEAAFVGFAAYWKLHNCFYLEHLAIQSAQRGEGLGTRFINYFKEQAGDTPLVLEAELPHDAIAQKRIHFYSQQDIFPINLPYAQPPYTAEATPIPMLLLSNQPKLVEEQWETIVRCIHSEVYEPYRSSH